LPDSTDVDEIYAIAERENITHFVYSSNPIVYFLAGQRTFSKESNALIARLESDPRFKTHTFSYVNFGANNTLYVFEVLS